MASDRTRRFMGAVIICAVVLTCTPAFAQTGGVTGKVVGPDGKPAVGYTILIERVSIKWKESIKTHKKGDFIAIGLVPDNYKLTVMDPQGNTVDSQETHVGLDSVEVNFNLKQTIEETKKQQEASPEFQKQVEEEKQTASLKQIFDQGRQLYEEKHYTEAAAAFEKALPLAKKQNVGVVMGQLADSWDRAGAAEADPEVRKQDYAKSLDYYTKILALAPSDAGIHNNLGNLYADMGRNSDAVAEFQKAAELDPARASKYYYNLGAIMVNKGQMDDAATALKKATDLDPNNANAWYWYGMALMGKATVKPDGTMIPAPGTVEAFETYLKLAPTGSFADAAKASLATFQTKTSLEYKAHKHGH